MGSMPIVAMEPVEQFGGSLIGVLVGLGVGPFAQRGLDEALRLAVGPGGIGPSEDLAKGKALAGCSETCAFVIGLALGLVL
jgi:hypothetical protein